MRKVHFYGKLAKEFGAEFTVSVKTIGELVRLMEANFPQRFMKELRTGSYHILVGEISEGHDLGEDRLGIGLPDGDIYIIPVGHGAGGNNGIFQVVIGIVMIIVAIFTWGASAYAWGAYVGGTGITAGQMAVMGAAMAFAGVATMMTARVSAGNYSDRESPDERQSAIYNGAVNTLEQGGPVPVVYGEMLVGSAVVSGGVAVENIS